MKISETGMSMVRGDSESFSVTLKDYTVQSGDRAEFTVRKKEDSPVLIHKVQEFTPGGENRVIFVIDPEDTQNLASGNYVYDIQITISGLVKTPRKGVLTLGWDVT